MMMIDVKKIGFCEKCKMYVFNNACDRIHNDFCKGKLIFSEWVRVDSLKKELCSMIDKYGDFVIVHQIKNDFESFLFGEATKNKENPMCYCLECNKYLGFRGFCSKECHDKYYDKFGEATKTKKEVEK